MAAAPPLYKPDGTRVPLQARAKRTYENILRATQVILQDSGLEALNTNAVAEKAGVTTPVVYRYFKDKYALLTVLGEQLTNAQNEIYKDGDEDGRSTNDDADIKNVILDVLNRTYDVTAAFVGAGALLTSLRVIPGLSSVRLDANRQMAELTAARLQTLRPGMSREEAYERGRLGVEVGYSAVEMLLEAPDMRARNILQLTASAISDIYLGGDD